jgi:hypothetical protein
MRQPFALRHCDVTIGEQWSRLVCAFVRNACAKISRSVGGGYQQLSCLQLPQVFVRMSRGDLTFVVGPLSSERVRDAGLLPVGYHGLCLASDGAGTGLACRTSSCPGMTFLSEITISVPRALRESRVEMLTPWQCQHKTLYRQIDQWKQGRDRSSSNYNHRELAVRFSLTNRLLIARNCRVQIGFKRTPVGFSTLD